MRKFECYLECGHKLDWRETPLDVAPHLPHEGAIAYCAICEADQEIAEVEPQKWIIEIETLSETEPRQTPCPPSGMAWQAGDEVIVFYDTRSGTYGYCFSGVSPDGLAYESDDVTGFTSPEEALQDAREAYAEALKERELEQQVLRSMD